MKWYSGWLAACLISLAVFGAQARAPVAPAAQAYSAHLPALQVAAGGHYFTTSDGKPFFWLGDTAWELIHATTMDEADYYLTTRSRQGFTVVQTVVLAEMDGITKQTPEGLTPFIDNDPAKPNPAYFDKVAAIVERADRLGLYVALLPSWADKMTAPWGAGPRLFPIDHPEIARAYGQYLGARLKAYHNIIWMMGGDRPSHIDAATDNYARQAAIQAGFSADADWRPVWGAMADGIRAGYGKDALFAYHPNGGANGTAVDLKGVPWLDINGRQSGHGAGHDTPIWTAIAGDFALGKPTLDLEPNYEDHPYNPWPTWDPSSGYFTDYDVRKQTYRSVFAGGAGVTYGHHSVWQFAGPRNPGINHAMIDWVGALQRPGGREMQYLRDLIESRPMLSRIPDDGLILKGQGDSGLHMTATRDDKGTYAFVYFPLNDQPATIDLSRLSAHILHAWWYDPRTGVAARLGDVSGPTLNVKSPPQGSDWVLVLDDPAQNYSPPGLPY